MDRPFSVKPLDESPGYLVNLLAVQFSNNLRRVFLEAGQDITPQQWAVLSRLWEEDGLHQSLLAERTSKNRHNMARILALLENAGLVERRADPHDARLQRVYLTPRGRGMETVLPPLALSALDRAFAGLTPEETGAWMGTTRRMLRNLDNPPPERSGGEREEKA